jgi:membrane fusion protein (multidrug efflux system)
MATTQERLAPQAELHEDGVTPVETNGRRRRFIIPAVVILVIVGLIFGIRYLVFASHHVTTDDAQIGGDITTVAPRVKGQVQAVYVHENQTVHKGDILLKIDPSDYTVAVQQAQAALSQAEANQAAANEGVPLQAALTGAQTAQAQAGIDQAGGQVAASADNVLSARAGIAAAQQRVAAARAQATAAQAAAVKAQQDEARAQTLVSQGAISQSQYDAYKSAADAAVANQSAAQHDIDVAQAQAAQANQAWHQAQAALVQAQAGISASDAMLQQAQTGNQTTTIKAAQAETATAQVKAAQAALASAQLQLSYTTIRASVDGVVSKKSVDVGDNVAVGQPLMAIASATGLWVTANLKETQITNVRVGQPVDITVDAFPGRTFTGKVESLSPATGATFALIPPDNASGNFTKVVQRLPIRTTVDASSDPEHLLRQGLSVEIAIDTTNH